MDYEVRRVPIDWEHPKVYNSARALVYDPLLPDYIAAVDRYCDAWREHARGNISRSMPDVQFKDQYMPVWPDDTELGYCLYGIDDSGAGVPASPIISTAFGLADEMVAYGWQVHCQTSVMIGLHLSRESGTTHYVTINIDPLEN